MRLSVVIGWVNDYRWLAPGLEALADQTGPQPDEIIVATRHDLSQCDRFRARHPGVTLLAGSPQDSIPTLRAMALERATGDVVAVTEDHCVPDRRWTEALLRRIDAGARVVGGPIENDCDTRRRDQAAFLCEYGWAIGPGDAGPVDALPGNNVAYTRDLVGGLRETLASERWESFYHDALRRGGVKLDYEPAMVMRHRRSFDAGYFCGQRFHFGRSFAHMRNQGWGLFRRLLYGGGCVLLPAILWWRGLSALRRKRRYVARYLALTPLIVVYLCAGALGEWTGYVFGGGNSLERVQ